METAKIFWTGRSLAVRLPKEFRLEGPEVRIRRQGAAVILEPIPQDWSWLETLPPLDADAVEAATESVGGQERPQLDGLFR